MKFPDGPTFLSTASLSSVKCEKAPMVITYRPSIDGLRAIAVMSVCVFHLNHQWLPGGFVGVDVFFVISGYLITSIISRDCQEGRFSFLRFYQRRVGRIVPASFAVVLFSLGLGLILHTAMDAASTGAAAAAAVSGVMNIKLLMQGNYFEASPDAQPLLHFWSLSLEEQFYLIYPAFYFWLATRFPRGKLPALTVLGAISLIWCVVLTPNHPTPAFYLLPTRAWELLAGCAVANLREAERFKAAMPGGGVLGFCMLLVAVLFTPNNRSFPGLWPLLPVVGTSVLLWHIEQPSLVNRLLAASPMVAIGRLSYSLYLWHWPIFSYVDYTMLFATEGLRSAWKCFFAALATSASYWLVEKPCRMSLAMPNRLVAATLVLLGSLAVGVTLGLLVRKEMYVNTTMREMSRGGKRFFSAPDAIEVALVGDSHGCMYAAAMRKACVRARINLTVLSLNGGDPLPIDNGDNPVWDATTSTIRKLRPDVVVMACDWRKKLADHPERLRSALEFMLSVTGRVIIITQAPLLPPNATRAAIRGGSRPPFFEEPDTKAARLFANEIVKNTASARCDILDAAVLFESSEGKIAWCDYLGRQYFQDRNHLSGVGASRVVVGVMRLLDLEEVGDVPKTQPDDQSETRSHEKTTSESTRNERGDT